MPGAWSWLMPGLCVSKALHGFGFALQSMYMHWHLACWFLHYCGACFTSCIHLQSSNMGDALTRKCRRGLWNKSKNLPFHRFLTVYTVCRTSSTLREHLLNVTACLDTPSDSTSVPIADSPESEHIPLHSSSVHRFVLVVDLDNSLPQQVIHPSQGGEKNKCHVLSAAAIQLHTHFPVSPLNTT